MTNTNKKHDEAVNLVKRELENSGFLRNVRKDGVPDGVDLQASYGNEDYYFAVISGKKQKSKSVYAAVSARTWNFVKEKSSKLFFIAAIEENDTFKYFCYTATEMWERSNNPYVHLKCNPLKKGSPLQTIEETFKHSISEERLKGKGEMVTSLNKLSKLVGDLQMIKK